MAAHGMILTLVSILVYSYCSGILQGYGTMIESHILALSASQQRSAARSCIPLVVDRVTEVLCRAGSEGRTNDIEESI